MKVSGSQLAAFGFPADEEVPAAPEPRAAQPRTVQPRAAPAVASAPQISVLAKALIAMREDITKLASVLGSTQAAVSQLQRELARLTGGTVVVGGSGGAGRAGAAEMPSMNAAQPEMASQPPAHADIRPPTEAEADAAFFGGGEDE